MIQITAMAVAKLQKSKPLILGGYVTTEKRLYSEYLPEAKHLLSDESESIINAIEEIKLTSELSAESVKRLETIVNQKRNDVDCVILACTELPIIYSNRPICGMETIDSNLEYAREVVRYAQNAL